MILPTPDPFGGGNMSNSKSKSEKNKVRQNLTEIVRKKSAENRRKQKYEWDIIINFVPFENDNDRQKSYESWIESFFSRSN